MVHQHGYENGATCPNTSHIPFFPEPMPLTNDSLAGTLACYSGSMLKATRHLAVATVLSATMAFGLMAQTPAQTENRPNIIFLLLDDMGYADVGAYGNTYHRTPHIDRLAKEGMRFTDSYAAAPNCSPTRASILTGRWPARLGLTQYLPGNVLPHAKLLQAELPLGLPLDETVIAEPLGAAGYATACVGKWHLGGGEYLPEKRGFDESFASGHLGSHRTMFAPHKWLKVPGAQAGDYLTDKLTAAAERFIEENRSNPFFLYMSYYAVHGPIQAKQSLIDSYAGRTDPTNRNHAVYAAMVEGVDRSVGRLLALLERHGLASNTAIFFFSDNGGVPSRAFNGGFRSGKGYVWEGGIREPLLVRWPGVVQAGSVEDTPVSSIDFYPTLLEMTAAEDSEGHTVDGTSLVPLLKQTGGLERDTLYWHYPHYSNAGSAPTAAIRKGAWKLLEFYEDSHVELYDLSTDPAESKDLSSVEKKRAEAMQQELAAWRASVNAKMPQPNPNFDASKAKERHPTLYKPNWDPSDPFLRRE